MIQYDILCFRDERTNPKFSEHTPTTFCDCFVKGWLAIGRLKTLSLFISLFQHCQMLSEALIIEK